MIDFFWFDGRYYRNCIYGSKMCYDYKNGANCPLMKLTNIQGDINVCKSCLISLMDITEQEYAIFQKEYYSFTYRKDNVLLDPHKIMILIQEEYENEV